MRGVLHASTCAPPRAAALRGWRPHAPRTTLGAQRQGAAGQWAHLFSLGEYAGQATADEHLSSHPSHPARTHERKVCFEVVGYLLEELRDAGNLEAFKKDVEESNIFIGSLIFIEELAEKVGGGVRAWVGPGCPTCGSHACLASSPLLVSPPPPAPLPTAVRPAMHPSPLQITAVVGPQRDRLDACLVFPSMPAVMKLNKLGTFSMAQLGQSKSIIGDFIKSARKVGLCPLASANTCCGCCCSWPRVFYRS